MRTAKEIAELELELQKRIEKQKRAKESELNNRAWQSDIDPEVYYHSPVEDIAKARINYYEKEQAVDSLIKMLRDVSTHSAEEMIEKEARFVESGQTAKRWVLAEAQELIEELEIW